MKTKRKAIRMVGVIAKMTQPIVLCVYLMFHDVRLILHLCYEWSVQVENERVINFA
jgi:hypothetical protein